MSEPHKEKSATSFDMTDEVLSDCDLYFTELRLEVLEHLRVGDSVD